MDDRGPFDPPRSTGPGPPSVGRPSSREWLRGRGTGRRRASPAAPHAWRAGRPSSALFVLVLVLGASLAIVGCSGSDGDDEGAGSRATSTEASPAAGTDSGAGSSTAGAGGTTAGGDAGSPDTAGDEMATFTLTSSFADGTSMPATYACKRAGGGEKSPPLSWTGVPDGTERLVLVVHDPDAPAAGGFTHLVTDLPLDTDHVDEGANAERNGPMADWIPACPPSGEHHYNFNLYAFGSDVDLSADPDKAAVDAVADQALGTATLTGLFAAPS